MKVMYYENTDDHTIYYFQVLFVNGPEEGCGGNINITSTTQFRSQRAETYEPLQDCHWLVTAPPGYTIQFAINEIDLKNTTFNTTSVNNKMGCNSDYIEVCTLKIIFSKSNLCIIYC